MKSKNYFFLLLFVLSLFSAGQTNGTSPGQEEETLFDLGFLEDYFDSRYNQRYVSVGGDMIQGNLTVSGILTIGKLLKISGPLELTNSLQVQGVSYLNGSILNTDPGSAISIADDLAVWGTSWFRVDATFEGSTNFQGSILNKVGDLRIDDNLNVYKDFNIQGVITNKENGPVEIADRLTVSGETRISDLTVVNSLDLQQAEVEGLDLEYLNAAKLTKGTIPLARIKGLTNKQIALDAKINPEKIKGLPTALESKLNTAGGTLTGAVSLEGTAATLSVAGAVTLSGATTIQSAATLNGAATFNGAVTFVGSTTMGDVTTGDLTIGSNEQLDVSNAIIVGLDVSDLEGGDDLLTLTDLTDTNIPDTITISSIADSSLSSNIPRFDTAGTISGDWVNTTNPWADNEVSDTLTASNLVAGSSVVSDAEVDDTITVSNYLPLAGGTMTGNITLGTNSIIANSNTISATELSLLDGETDIGLSILTDTNIPNDLTIASTSTGSFITSAASGSSVLSLNQTSATAADATRAVLNLATSGTSNTNDFLIYSTPFSVDRNGNVNIASGANYKINGSQISSDNLSDVASIAMLDEGETITGDWVNTTYPWTDAEVDNNITASNYLPLAGGTMTGNTTTQKADPSIIFDTVTTGDTDFWLGVDEDAGGDDDDTFVIGKGTTPMSNTRFAMAGGGATTITGSVTINTSAAQLIFGTATYNGPHGIRFDDESAIAGVGMQLLYRNSPNQLIVEAQSDGNDGTDLFGIDNDTGAVGLQDAVAIGSTNLNNSFVVGNGALCVDDGGTNCDDAARTAGNIYAEATTITAIDLAENYPTLDETLEAADVVALNSSSGIPFVVKTNSSTDQLLGVVSTKPGILLGGFDASQYKEYRQVPIALSGRVPVKVSTENGAIKPGDRLTASSQAGVAMKADSDDPSIGLSLQSYNQEGVGKILVFINLESQGYRNEKERKTTSILKKIITEFKEKVSFLGEVLFKERVTFADQDMGGVLTIKKGEKEVKVQFNQEYRAKPVINITFEDAFSQPYQLEDVSNKGFTIELKEKAEKEIKINWLAIEINKY